MLKARVRRAFDRAAPDYADSADIQRRVAGGLAERLAPDTKINRILDAGCGTGFGIDLMRTRWPDADIVALDHASQMLAQLDHRCRLPVCADVEALPLASASIDLYWSSLTLQWCNLGRALGEAKRVVRPDGTIAFATLGSETFREVRTAFAGVDAHPHTLAFLAPESIADTMHRLGFQGIAFSTDRVEACYPDLKSLLRSIRRVGAGEVGDQRRRGLLGKYAWMTVEAQYARFRRGSDCPLTYDVIYVTART